MQIASAIEYQKHINVIDRILYLFGVGLLGTLFKLIFEAWLIYSVSIFREYKKGIIQTNTEMLKSRIIAAKVIAVPPFIVIIGTFFYILIIGDYMKLLAPILFSGVPLAYIISVRVSYYFATKYINKYEKNT